MPVKYALAFAIIVLSLAGAYYMLQQAEQPASQQVQEQQEADTTSQSVSQNVTNTTRQATSTNATAASPEPCISNVHGTASAGKRAVTLTVWAERPCNATITVDYFGGEWSGQLSEGENNIRIIVEREPRPGDQAIVRIKTGEGQHTFITIFGP
ncbi:MAG: hypothetical protein GSR84_03140 [Desulfurococcales archaeon]|nr:hypothetical protein [Desulfurococcales archaeon]